MKHGSVLIMSSVRWYNASAHYALYLAQSLKKSGIEAVVFGIPGSPLIIKAKEYAIEVRDDINLMNTGFFAYLKNLIKFRRIVKENNFDIINPHISRDHIFAFFSLIGTKKYILRNRTDSIAPKKNILNKIFYQISSSHYIVSSKYMISQITQMGISKNRVTAIPLEMNYKDFTAYKPKRNLKHKLNIPENKIVVSYIGRLDRIKGIEYFIKSFNFIKNKENLHYVISGEEINLSIKKLKELSCNLDIYSISITGKADDVRDILSITDIGVIPSLGSEAICRIGLELLSYGIPIVGSNINSIPELVSDFGGIVVNPGSPEEIAAALDYLAVPENYKRMKEKILSTIAERSPDRFVMEYLDIFSKLLGE